MLALLNTLTVAITMEDAIAPRWNFADSNHDGVLDTSETAVLMSVLNASCAGDLTYDYPERLLQLGDEDDSGYLTKEEFLRGVHAVRHMSVGDTGTCPVACYCPGECEGDACGNVDHVTAEYCVATEGKELFLPMGVCLCGADGWSGCEWPGSRTVGWLCKYVCFVCAFFLFMQGVGFVFGGPKGLKSNPIGDLKKHIAPHMIEMVKAEPKLDWGKLVLPPDPKPEQLTHGAIAVLTHMLKLFGVLTFFVGGLGVYVGIQAVLNPSDFMAGLMATVFVLTFLLVSVGFQCVHVFQPFPGEGKFTPWIGLAINVVIVAPLIIVDVLGAFGQLG